EGRIGGDDGADAGGGGLLVDEVGGFGPGGAGVLDRSRSLGGGRGLGGAEDRLLLMAGTPAEHRIEPKPYEQRHHCQQYDPNGHANSPVTSLEDLHRLRAPRIQMPQGPERSAAMLHGPAPPATRRCEHGPLRRPFSIRYKIEGRATWPKKRARPTKPSSSSRTARTRCRRSESSPNM